MKNISVLGSTGSIGKNVLDIVSRFPESFSVKALAAATRIDELARQIETFRPEMAVVLTKDHANALKNRLSPGHSVTILYGDEGYKQAAIHPDVHMVVSAIVGAAGLVPTVAAINAGKDIALANKETLVTAGDYVMALAREKNIRILPVDSEHSAVFQCIEGQSRKALAKIILTASGGPFRKMPQDKFKTIRPEDALAHPTWNMGKKISIDSATLMNKGLEVIEAKHLFDLSPEQIDVVVHSQSIVHSMAVFHDGSVLAQMGIPDMRAAIAYAMSWPERLPLAMPVPDFAELGSLVFEKPDRVKFPCLSLAYTACREGHTLPAVMNAANEVAVQAFLEKKISFVAIAEVIERTMDKHLLEKKPDLLDIIRTDSWARNQAETIIKDLPRM
ncbi:MAG: 1-deoxy-D-xylulose-5-phosphate reductoisomerase [Proteobacteria bacterium]|nr:1-deoxy-D-xylulose-5-phosphate reductoisomerase [Pseudomonadota bacterium]